MIAVAALMFVWLLLRYVKYHFFMPYDTASRYLWYLYYVPQCFVPPLTLIAALGLTGKSNRAMSKYVYLLLVPAFILVILILTNDLHQTAFVFGKNFENFEKVYEHGALYYVTMVWIGGVMAAVVVTLFVKCSISACRQKAWVPIAVAALCTLAGTLCFMFATRSYKVPELFIFSYILIMESCVRIGLVPSNENYEKFFAASSVSSVITDENLCPVFRTAAIAETDMAPYERAKAEGTVLLDDNTRLSCKRISGGNVFYAENISAINELLGKLSVVNETLTEEGDLIAYENELKERKAKTEQKSRLYSKIFDIASESLDEINAYIGSIDESLENYETNLRAACVYLAYIKRRSNLEIIASQSESIDLNEIALSVKESLACLSDCGISVSFVGGASGTCGARQGILLYEFFQECIRRAMPTLSGVIVKLSSSKGGISLRAVTTDCADSAKDFSDGEIERLGGKITIVAEDECLYQTLKFGQGGAEK